MDRRLGGPQSRSGRGGEEKKSSEVVNYFEGIIWKTKKNHDICGWGHLDPKLYPECTSHSILTNSMKLSPSWDADSRSVLQFPPFMEPERSRHWSPSRATWIQSTHTHTHTHTHIRFFKIKHPIPSLHLRTNLQVVPTLQVFQLELYTLLFYPVRATCYAPLLFFNFTTLFSTDSYIIVRIIYQRLVLRLSWQWWFELFWAVIPFCVVIGYQRFRGPCCLHSLGLQSNDTV
jgi:hypothetical protein